MIRPESFTVSRETFAAERKQVLTDAAEQLRPHIKEALSRVGLPSWEAPVVDAALDLFDLTARNEVDEWGPVMDDMRDLFAKELGEALAKTKSASNKEHQLDTITGWVAQMAHNAGIEAATTADPDGGVGLEWVTMGDSSVRDPHREANGQTVPTGHEFEVGGEKLLYPGDPKGDPSIWLNCRCLARPVMLNSTLTSVVGEHSDSFASLAAPLPGSSNDLPVVVPLAAQASAVGDSAGAAASGDVHGVGNVPEMGGANAKGYFAHVVDDLVRPDAVLQPPGNPVGGNLAVHAANPEVAVTGAAAAPAVATASPDPALAKLWDFIGDLAKSNLGPKAFSESFIPSSHTPSVPVSLTAAGEGNASDPGVEPGEEPRAAVVVLRPRVEDPVTAMASGVHPHCTLLYLGDGTVDLEPLKAIVEALANGLGHPMTDKVSGRAVLGKDAADVLLLDASGSGAVRAELLANDGVLELLGMQEQFPAWIPHITVGYPEAPAEDVEMPADVTYDLLSIWRGNEIYDYPLEVAVPESTEAPEVPDAVTAAVEDAVPAPADAPAEAPAPAAEEQLRPWHGVLAPEGAPSGDKRGFAAKMLTMRDLPLPLKAQFVDDEGHRGSMVVGRIDEVYRDGGLIKAAGVWDNTPEADKAMGMIERKMWRGVSVDLDAAEGEMVEAAEEGKQPSVVFTEGRVCSSTLCAIPAFAEAFIRNGTWDEFANEPMPSGAMNEIPDWSTAAKTPALSLVASAAPVISADYFRNPMLEEPTPVTRGENGLVFGHLGIWEQCHIAYEVCTTVPPSETDYAYFLTGQVFTDAGPVAVGQLTVGGGHADMKLGIRAAMAHYDNVASAVADITVGEDEHGVWFSGRIRPWATEKQIHEMFAAGPSGDWRGVRYRGRDSMEMVAAHAVNVPGFPIPRAKFAVEGGRQVSLVAAGMVHDRVKETTALFSDIRDMLAVDVFNEITTLKGK